MATGWSLDEWRIGVFPRLRPVKFGMRLTAMTGTGALWPLLVVKPAINVSLLGLVLPALFLVTHFVRAHG